MTVLMTDLHLETFCVSYILFDFLCRETKSLKIQLLLQYYWWYYYSFIYIYIFMTTLIYKHI